MIILTYVWIHDNLNLCMNTWHLRIDTWQRPEYIIPTRTVFKYRLIVYSHFIQQITISYLNTLKQNIIIIGVCVCECVCACTCAWVYVCVHVSVRASECACVQVCMRVCMCVCTYSTWLLTDTWSICNLVVTC